MYTEIDDIIIQKATEGEMQAFEKIYRHYNKLVYGFSLRMTGNTAEAEDATQNTFLKLFRGIKNFKFNAKFSTYLMRIARNVCIDLFHQRKSDQLTLDETFLSSPAQDNLNELHIRELILKLPEKMRVCFILFAVEGFPQEEISEILQVSVGTVKSHIFAARKKLRNQLEVV